MALYLSDDEDYYDYYDDYDDFDDSLVVSLSPGVPYPFCCPSLTH